MSQMKLTGGGMCVHDSNSSRIVYCCNDRAAALPEMRRQGYEPQSCKGDFGSPFNPKGGKRHQSSQPQKYSYGYKPQDCKRDIIPQKRKGGFTSLIVSSGYGWWPVHEIGGAVMIPRY